jgi:SAM-dependent methyltransferase
VSQPSEVDLDSIRTGFSAMAAEYDALAETHPVVIWLRNRIRGLVERELKPPGAILEINAGSGLDAAYFAARGYRIHATDVAPGMLAALASKAEQPATGGRLTYETLSNTELSAASGGPYDLVFSNLGGLNCIEDLSRVTQHLRDVLKPGGKAVLVVMPPLCPWELAQVLRRHRRTAFRRLSRGGTLANVGGATIRVWYHSPGKLARALGPGFETLTLRSFCSFAPPSFFQGFAARHPSLSRALMGTDDRLGRFWPFNQVGDFYAQVSRLKTK